MAIHYFPGHMSTAMDEIRRVMPKVDLIIQILDARIPFSSDNPVVGALRGARPCVQVLNKSDLAEPQITADWLEAFNRTPGLRAIEHNRRMTGLKQSLMAAIWPDTVVEENNLNQSISAIRRALNESARDNRFIVTVPGRGYRFVAIVTRVDESSDSDEASVIVTPPTTHSNRRRLSLALAALLLGAIAFYALAPMLSASRTTRSCRFVPC